MKNIPRASLKIVKKLVNETARDYPIILSILLQKFTHAYNDKEDWKVGWTILDYLNHIGELNKFYKMLQHDLKNNNMPKV